MEGVKTMSAILLEQITPVWTDVSKHIHVLHTEHDYEQAVSLLDSLIDTVGENEQHPLASLMELLGVLIEQYENEYIPEITDI
jgi:HTH-type transcriptional regulator/antitoxin HigA